MRFESTAVICDRCGIPVSALAKSTAASGLIVCPFCGHADVLADPSSRLDVDELRAALYFMDLPTLQRLKAVLQFPEDTATEDALAARLALVSARLADWARQEGDTATVRQALATVVDVLLALWVVCDETATPGQLEAVVGNVADGRLAELPLPRRSPCFCGSGRRYGKCHGRHP
jgi:SEC-C motif